MSVTMRSTADYYARYVEEGSELPGEWTGRGAKELGISGKFGPEALTNLLNGLHPDGTHALIAEVKWKPGDGYLSESSPLQQRPDIGGKDDK